VPGIAPDILRSLFVGACRTELQALKPGNVHIHASGHGMEATHFEAGAQAAAPWVAAADTPIGARILKAVEASLAAAGCNTNLGIVLLCAPLATAAAMDCEGDLRERLRIVLDAFDEADARAVYEAIRIANPGGLGTASQEDVAEPPTLGLLQAMALAAGRDRIARAYVTGFEDIFSFGLPTLKEALYQSGEISRAVTSLHMAYLAAYPDSHIARKFGTETADAVQHQALSLKPVWQSPISPDAFQALLRFDTYLKQRDINPGTTADFVVATLFAASICGRMRALDPGA